MPAVTGQLGVFSTLSLAAGPARSSLVSKARSAASQGQVPTRCEAQKADAAQATENASDFNRRSIFLAEGAISSGGHNWRAAAEETTSATLNRTVSSETSSASQYTSSLAIAEAWPAGGSGLKTVGGRKSLARARVAHLLAANLSSRKWGALRMGADWLAAPVLKQEDTRLTGSMMGEKTSTLSSTRADTVTKSIPRSSSSIPRPLSSCSSSSPSGPSSKTFDPLLHLLYLFPSCMATPPLSTISSNTFRPALRLLSLFPASLAALPFSGFGLEGPGSVLQAILVLAVIVTVHEAGHFLAARSLGIRVTKFSVGFGPVLWSATGESDGVEYALRLIPLGGYVGFPEEDDPELNIPKDDPDLLRNRSILQRAFVISAGVIANAIFAYALLFTQVNSVGLVRQVFFPGAIIPEVSPGSAGARAGLQAGDLVLAVEGRVLPASEKAVSQVVSAVKSSVGEPVTLLVQRGGQSNTVLESGTAPSSDGVQAPALKVTVVPEAGRDGGGRIGVQLMPNAVQFQEKAPNVLQGAAVAAKEYSFLLGTVLNGLKEIVTNFAQTADKVSGPVAIVAVGAEVARTNLAGLFQFSAIVNLNLAVVNLLPLPALDGGYLVLLMVEAVRGGKRIPMEVERAIMSSGLLAFLGIGVFLIVRDSMNLGFLP